MRSPQPSPKVARFGIFEADLVAGELRKRGRKVELQDQPFRVLALLLQRPKEVVTREEFRQALWPANTFVEFDESLNKAVQKLRQALGDSADNPRFIETLPRKGYRFIAPVEYKGGQPWATWLAVAALGVAVIAGAVWFTGSTRRVVPVPFTAVPLTDSPGWEADPSLSPDGTQVAFYSGLAGQNNVDIYVKPIGGGSPIRLTTDPAIDYSPAWSPDGTSIAFLRRREDKRELLLVPPLGGKERNLAELHPEEPGGPAYSCLAWSPEGKHIAFADSSSPGTPFAVFVHSLTTRETWKLTNPPVGSLGDSDPAFSPDGRTLAFIRCPAWGISYLQFLSLSGNLRPAGEPRRLVLPQRAVNHPVWTPDGREVVFSAGDVGQQGLWRVAVSGSGGPKPLALPAEKAVTPQISKDGRRLVYVAVTLVFNLRQIEIPARENAAPRRITPSTQWDTDPQYSPDGRQIAFASYRSGDLEIWRCEPDGSNATSVTSLPVSFCPRWFPDSRRIVFISNKGGNFDVWSIDTEGGVPKRLTTDPVNKVYPSVSRDGKSIYFASNRTGRYEIWRMPSEGGEAVQVTRRGGAVPFESADGKDVYYLRAMASPSELWKVPVGGGEETQVLPSVVDRTFHVGRDGIYFMRFPDVHGGLSLQFFHFARRTYTEIARIEGETNLGLAISPDGRFAVYTQIEQSNADLMLVENFR